MRTTVTIASEKVNLLMRQGRYKSKARAVEEAVDVALRFKAVDRLEARRGHLTFDRRVLKWRDLPR